MATYTTRLGLYKPAADGSENVNVVSDLNDNWDRLDAMVSYVPVTTGTYPASAYRGEAFYETDTGKGYVNTSAVASSISKAQVLVAGASFDSNITMASSALQVLIGGTASTASFGAQRASASDTLLSGRITGASANSAFTATIGGTLGWGAGGASVTDTNLYRSGANILATDDSLTVGGSLTVTASANLDDTIVGGNFFVGSARFQPQLHIATTVSNTTNETSLQTFNIPANDAVTGAVYRIRAYGTAQVTGTPTMTFRFKIGGTGGTTLQAISAITARSGMSDGWWEIEALVTCSATGASGTFSPFIRGTHNFVTGVGTITTMATTVTASVTRDTTVSNDLILSGQWSAASSSNSIVCRGSLIERMA